MSSGFFAEMDEVVKQLGPQNGKETYGKDTCEHLNFTRELGVKTCIGCGKELASDSEADKDDKQTPRLDPGRCQIRKNEEKSIAKDVEKMNFSDAIVRSANSIFQETTKGHIFRGNSRRAVIFACIFHAYKLAGNPQSCDSLIDLFNLERKVGLRGLKMVGLNAPKNSLIRTAHITAVDLIKEIMKQFAASDSQIADVVALHERIENTSSVLNRSRPQSVAAGLVYFFIRLKQKEIPIKDFVDVVNLSELTVLKIAREIARLLGTPEIMY